MEGTTNRKGLNIKHLCKCLIMLFVTVSIGNLHGQTYVPGIAGKPFNYTRATKNEKLKVVMIGASQIQPEAGCAAVDEPNNNYKGAVKYTTKTGGFTTDNTQGYSSADVTLGYFSDYPNSCPKIKYAYLYWGGSAYAQNVNAKYWENEVYITKPDGNESAGIKAQYYGSTEGFESIRNGGDANTDDCMSYWAMADVSSVLAGQGIGTIGVRGVTGDIADTKGGPIAGWNLVLLYEDGINDSYPQTQFNLFDGAAFFKEGSSVDKTLGFTAVTSGIISGSIGIAGLDGDVGKKTDNVTFTANGGGSTQNLNDLRGTTDFMSSSMSYNGESMSHTENTAFGCSNTLGYDAHHIDLPAGAVTNSSNSATISLSTQDSYMMPFMAYVAINSDVPSLILSKVPSSTNVSPGQKLKYFIALKNEGGKRTQPNTAYVEDLLDYNVEYLSGTATITMSDGSYTDQVWSNVTYNKASRKLTISELPEIPAGATLTITYQVQVAGPERGDLWRSSCMQEIWNMAEATYFDEDHADIAKHAKSGTVQLCSNTSTYNIIPVKADFDSDYYMDVVVHNVTEDNGSVGLSTYLKQVLQGELKNDTKSLDGIATEPDFQFYTSTGSAVSGNLNITPGETQTYYARRTLTTHSYKPACEVDEVEIQLVRKTCKLVAGDIVVTNPTCAGLSDGTITLENASEIQDWAKGMRFDLVSGKIEKQPDGSIPVTAADIIGTYKTSSAETSHTFKGLAAGDYSILLTDGLGCKFINNGTIVAPDPIEVTVEGTAACIGNRVEFTATATGGTAGTDYYYKWYRSANGTTYLEDDSQGDDATYSVTSQSDKIYVKAEAYSTIAECSFSVCKGEGTKMVELSKAPELKWDDAMGAEKDATTKAWSVTICEGESADLTAVDELGGTGATIKWETSTDGTTWGNDAATTATKTVSPTVSTHYRTTWTAAGGCEDMIEILVNVNPKPAIGDKTYTICSGETFTFATEAGDRVPTGTTYTWAKPSATGVTGMTAGTDATAIGEALTNSTAAAVNVVYNVTPKAGDCEGDAFTVTVTVNPKPTIAKKIYAICSGGTFTFATVAGDIVPTGTTYSWSTPTNGSVTGLEAGTDETGLSATLTNSATTDQTVTYTLTPKAGACIGEPFDVEVTVYAVPQITGVASICKGLTATLTATPTGGTWASSNDSYVSITNSGVITGMGDGTSTITYTTAAGCKTTKDVKGEICTSLKLTQTTSGSVCPGEEITLTFKVENLATAVANGVTVQNALPSNFTFKSATPSAEYNSATGLWTIGDIAASGTKTLTVVVTGTTAGTDIADQAYVATVNTDTYTAYADAPATMQAETKTTVKSKPVITVASPEAVCTPNKVEISGTASGATNYKYYSNAGATAEITNTEYSGAQTGTSYWVVGETDGCRSDAVEGNVTINELPTIALATGSDDAQTLCSSAATIDNIIYNIGGGATGATVTGLPNGVTGNYDNAAKTFTISGTATETGTFTYTVTTEGALGPCTNPSVTGTITINPEATLVHTSGSETQTLCSSAAMIESIVYTIGGGATGADVTGLPDGVNATVSGTTVTISGAATATGTFNYKVTTTGSASTCTEKELEGTITINPEATLVHTSGSETQTLCMSNAAIESVVYTLGGGATGAKLINSPAWLTGTYDGTAKTYTITGTAPSAGDYSYTVEAIGATTPCTNPQISGTIKVHALPVITNPGSVCYGKTATLTADIAAAATMPWVSSDPSVVSIDDDGTVHGVAESGTVTITYTDINGCQSTAEVKTEVCLALQLSATTPADVCPEDETTMTLTVKNTAALAATGIKVNCEIPANYEVTSTTPSIGYAGGVWTIGDLAVDAETTLTLTLKGKTSGTGISTKAYVSAVNGSTYASYDAAEGAMKKEVTSTVKAKPEITVTSPTDACTPTTIDIAGTATGADTYEYYSAYTDGTTNTPLTSTTFDAATPAGGTTYYVVGTTNGCKSDVKSGIVTINEAPTITLTSATATTTQTVCSDNAAITDIVYTLGGGATGATVTGLPAGVSLNVSGTTATISGTATATGTFNYTVTTTGATNPCTDVTATGTIVVNAAPTIELTSGNTNQTVCQDNATITGIVYTIGGGATGVEVTGLPNGVTGTLTGTTYTISGTATEAGTFNYTVKTKGVASPCTNPSLNGTIKVTQAVTADAGADQTKTCICSSATVDVTMAATAPATGTGKWTLKSTTAATAPTIADDVSATTAVTGLSAGTHVFTWTVTNGDIANGGCQATDDVTITIESDTEKPTFGLSATELTLTSTNCKFLVPDLSSYVTNKADNCTTLDADFTIKQDVAVGDELTSDKVVNITLTDRCGNVSDSKTITLKIPSALSVTPTKGDDILCNGGTTSSISVSVSGGATPYTYQWSGSSTATTKDITGIGAGTYAITVKDANGCEVTEPNIEITEPTIITGDATATAVTQPGNSDGKVTVTSVTGGYASTYEYELRQGTTVIKTYQDGTEFSGLSVGTYQVWAKCKVAGKTFDCEYMLQEVTVSDVADVVGTVTGANLTCNGNKTGKVTASVTSGGTAPYKLQLEKSDGSVVTGYGTDVTAGTNVEFGSLEAGTYQVRAKDNTGYEKLIKTNIVVSEPSVLIVSELTASHKDVKCNGGNDGAAEITVSGGTTAYSYAWSTTDGTLPATTDAATLSGVTKGTYTATVTDGNGCIASKEIMITEPNVLAVSEVTASHADVKCNGDATGVLKVSVTGGTAGYTYAWSTTDGTLPATTNEAKLNGAKAGTYTVEVTDANGCTATLGLTITEPVALTTDAGSDQTIEFICSDIAKDATKSVTLAAAVPTETGVTGTWTVTSQPTGSGTVAFADKNTAGTKATGLETGEYVFTWTIARVGVAGCTASDDVKVTVVPDTEKPTFTLSATTQAADVDPSQACTYKVPDLSSLVIGKNDNYSPSELSYSQTPVVGTVIEDATDVIITLTDKCGNISDGKTVKVTVPKTFDVDKVVTNAKVTCNGAKNAEINVTVTDKDPSSAFTYQWSGSSTATTEDLTGIGAGTYKLTVTRTSDQCKKSNVEVTITEPDAISVTAALVNNVSCYDGDNGSLKISSVSGGNGGYTYAWSNGQTGETASNFKVGKYTVTATDSKGCTGTSAEVEVTQPTQLGFQNLVTRDPACNGGSDGYITVEGKGGTAPYSYKWNTGTTTTDGRLAGLAAGTYNVTLTDKNNCTLDYPSGITLTDPTKITATLTASATSACVNGAEIILTGSSNLNHTNGTYSGDGVTGNRFSPSAAGTGTHTISYFISPNGCDSKAETTITVNELPTATVATTDVCEGTELKFIVTVSKGATPYTAEWSVNGTAESETGLTLTIPSASAGNNVGKVVVTDANGCVSASASATSSVTATPAVPTVTDLTVCNGSGMKAWHDLIEKDNEDQTLVWFSDATGVSQVAEPMSINYAIVGDRTSYVASSVNGCVSNVVEVKSSVHALPSIVSMEEASDYTTTLKVSGVAPFTYNIDDKLKEQFDGEANVGVLAIGRHSITITDEIGCKTDTLVTVDPEPLEPDKFFTPNDDGVNDRWMIKGLDRYEETKIFIHDRYGKELFSTDAKNFDGWDGKYNGNDLPGGDYWYIIEVRETGKRIVGHMLLKR